MLVKGITYNSLLLLIYTTYINIVYYNWEIVKKSRSKGGLVTRNIVWRNEALVAKWLREWTTY